FFFSSRRRHTRFSRDWSSDVCSSDLLNRDAPHLKLLASPPSQRYCFFLAASSACTPPSSAEPFMNHSSQPAHSVVDATRIGLPRSEERRVGREWRCGGSPEHRPNTSA